MNISGLRPHSLKSAAIAFALLLGFASGSTSAFAHSGPPKLSALLLNLKQMPPGWREELAPTNGIGCIGNLLEAKGVALTEYAVVEFVGNGIGPNVDERLARYANTRAAYAKIVTRLRACRVLSGSDEGAPFTGRLNSVNFPQFGTASTAFAANFTLDGQDYADDIAIVRTSGTILAIDDGNIAPVDTGQLESIIVRAVRKLG